MIYLYDPDLKNRIPIIHAISIDMDAPLFEVGKISMVLPADDYHAAHAKNNSLIYSEMVDRVFTIQEVEYDRKQNQLSLNGYTANWLLNKRSIKAKKKISTVEADCLQLVRDNLRGLPGVSVSPASGLTQKADAELYGGQLLDGMIPLLKEAGLGNKMTWDDATKTFTFSIFQGQDLTSGIHAVVFSESRGTAPDLVFTDDISLFSNVFLIELEYDDKSTEIVEYKLSEKAPDIREWWIKSKITQKKDESRQAAKDRAIQKCKEVAQDRLHRYTFKADLPMDDIGKRFNIGDKVLCRCDRLGVSLQVVISGIDYKMDANGTKAQAVLGDPVITILDEVRINGY